MAAGTAGQWPAVRRARRAGRIQLASDPATRWLRLWWLAVRDWPRRAVMRALAANPRAPKLLLRCLSTRRWDVQVAVAANPRCPRRTLRAMVWAPDWAVRAAVAANPAATPPILDGLISGSGAHVRLYVAANPSLTGALADRLLADRDAYVRATAAAHPAASPAGLQQVAAGMSEPAWILQAIAGNPACPPELADQLLTWIALGGPGYSDPQFNPLECTGNPGDTRFEPFVWYLEQAKRPGADYHPLWQVRASVLRAQGRISTERARSLARDPRPEVRRSIAAGQLPLAIRRELKRDADPQVAGLAAAVGTRNKKAERKQQARKLTPVLLRLAIPGAVGLSLLSSYLWQGSGPAPGTSSGTAASTAGAGQRGTNVPQAHILMLPGGGTIACDPSRASSDSAAVSVFAGSKELTLRTSHGGLIHPGSGSGSLQVTVPAGRQATFRVHPVASAVTIAAGGGAAAAVPVATFRCGS